MTRQSEQGEEHCIGDDEPGYSYAFLGRGKAISLVFSYSTSFEYIVSL